LSNGAAFPAKLLWIYWCCNSQYDPLIRLYNDCVPVRRFAPLACVDGCRTSAC
jgi:hypothetical protein